MKPHYLPLIAALAFLALAIQAKHAVSGVEDRLENMSLSIRESTERLHATRERISALRMTGDDLPDLNHRSGTQERKDEAERILKDNHERLIYAKRELQHLLDTAETEDPDIRRKLEIVDAQLRLQARLGASR